jgi:multicomponent K+:H+ antiporter subunit G
VTTPAWVDAVTGVLVAAGGLAALIGSLGVLRLGSFFQRVHAPTLGATAGTGCLALATVAQVSFARGQLFLHAALIAVFIALTAPITTIFLMRAAVFRERLRGTEGIPRLE